MHPTYKIKGRLNFTLSSLWFWNKWNTKRFHSKQILSIPSNHCSNVLELYASSCSIWDFLLVFPITSCGAQNDIGEMVFYAPRQVMIVYFWAKQAIAFETSTMSVANKWATFIFESSLVRLYDLFSAFRYLQRIWQTMRFLTMSCPDLHEHTQHEPLLYCYQMFIVYTSRSEYKCFA